MHLGSYNKGVLAPRSLQYGCGLQSGSPYGSFSVENWLAQMGVKYNPSSVGQKRTPTGVAGEPIWGCRGPFWGRKGQCTALNYGIELHSDTYRTRR